MGCAVTKALRIFGYMMVIGLAAALVPAAARAPSGSFADLAEQLLPSVVNISSTQAVERDKSGGEDYDDVPFDEWFRDYFENRRRGEGAPRQRRQTSLGSGFIVDAAGYIVTNNHVVENADKISVILYDDTVLEARVIGRDPKVDVALLKVKADRALKPLSWGNSDKVRVGDWALAIGNPFGLGGSVSAGIISARARDINVGQYDDFLQTDAAINRGNSGGPLLNTRGEVIGVNTAIFSLSGGNAGVGFAASANLVRPVIADLKKYGRTRRGWLGVRIQSVTPVIAESLELDIGRGALVADIDPDGPAAGADVRPGDVIVTFDGKEIERMRDLPRIVAATPVDREVAVEVWRAGERLAITLRVGELKEEALPKLAKMEEDPSPLAKTALADLGIDVSEITARARDEYGIPEDVKGLVVMDIDGDHAAAKSGLRLGDVIDEIQQTSVVTPSDAEAAIAAVKKDGRKSVLLRVITNGGVRYVGVKMGG